MLTAVKQLTFQLQRGEIFGLLGPNGAGKTSLISCIVGLEKPSDGDIFVFGESILKSPQKVKSQIGYVGQEVVNHGFFSVEEILDFQSGYYGLKNNTQKINELLHDLHLFEHRHKKVKQLSGGMKRRLMIAKALVHSPRLLLLDEPSAGVDIELRSQLWEYVIRLQKSGVTILLTTHYLEEAEKLCQRVAVLNKGEILALDQTHEFVKKSGSVETAVRQLLSEAKKQ